MSTYLILLPHNPGDIILGLHLVDALHRKDSDARIHFIVGHESRHLPALHKAVEKVFHLPQPILKVYDKAGKQGDGTQFLQDWISGIQKQTYDVSINLFQETWGAWLHSCIVSNQKIGMDVMHGSTPCMRSRFLEHCMSIPVARHDNPFHVVDLWKNAVDVSMYSTSAILKPYIHSELHFTLPGQKKSRIAIQPGSAWPGKEWPIDNWIELCELLINDNHHIVCLGAKEELQKTDMIAKKLSAKAQESFVNLAGKTELSQVPSIMMHCAQLITGDTFAMHAAASVGTPCICLFGPSNPIETGPYGAGHIIIQNRMHYSENLEFEQSDPRWIHLHPKHILGLIKDGTPPQGFSVWATAKHPKLHCQILISPQGERHPFQINLEKWHALLRDPPTHPSRPLPVEWDNTYQKCFEELSQENWSVLYQIEKKWEEKTRHNMIWEAYRIAASGVPLNPLSTHLLGRLRRLRQAFAEEELF